MNVQIFTTDTAPGCEVENVYGLAWGWSIYSKEEDAGTPPAVKALGELRSSAAERGANAILGFRIVPIHNVTGEVYPEKYTGSSGSTRTTVEFLAYGTAVTILPRPTLDAPNPASEASDAPTVASSPPSTGLWVVASGGVAYLRSAGDPFPG
jgi:uncharacterized protein YbjQ (UPF0145 family)